MQLSHENVLQQNKHDILDLLEEGGPFMVVFPTLDLSKPSSVSDSTARKMAYMSLNGR
jgi:hypothetical protein